MKVTTRNPWLWVPTLYFAEGIPYFIVNNISVLMLAKMGVPNGQMALFTSLLYLPWMIKPFWSPFVDIIRTKRWWIIAMQLLMSLAFIMLTLCIPHPSAAEIASGNTPIGLFGVTLILFAITAFASATHDIAADGFYMLALSTKNQAAFVGIRSTFYRLSSIFGQGVLVYIAGYTETHGLGFLGIEAGNIPASWQLTLGVTALIFSLVTLYHTFIVPRPATDHSRLDANHRTAGAGAIFREFANSFATFFTKKGLWLAIAFMLLYRLPEAFLIKMCTPFLVASKEVGGLGLSTENVGIVYGTIGVLFLTIGGIIGGVYASKVGLRKSHDSALPHLLLSGRSAARQSVVHQHRSGYRAVRLRLWFHSLYAVHDVLLGRRVHHLALRHLHSLHGHEHDVAGHGGRLPAGSARLRYVLLDGYCLLRRHTDCDILHRSQNRPDIRSEIKILTP